MRRWLDALDSVVILLIVMSVTFGVSVALAVMMVVAYHLGWRP